MTDRFIGVAMAILCLAVVLGCFVAGWNDAD